MNTWIFELNNFHVGPAGTGDLRKAFEYGFCKWG